MAPFIAATPPVQPSRPLIPTVPGRPEMLWPSVIFERLRSFEVRLDERCRPDRKSLHSRRRAVENGGRRPGDLLTLDAFIDAMVSAQARVLVMDPKFDPSSADLLEAVVETTDAADIRILSERHGPAERQFIAAVTSDPTALANSRSPRSAMEITVQWLPVLDEDEYPFLHQRSAIVDSELCHFGATVGGVHHGLPAASRDWSLDDTRALLFFDALWDDMSKPHRRHMSSGSPSRKKRG